MKRNIFILFFAAIIIFAASCNNSDDMQNDNQNNDSTKLTVYQYPDRIATSIIYEVNIRQYTPEGTFAAFEAHLPRLKDMGIDILWIMPVQPVGVKNRKGDLGSYYSIQNYIDVNPEFGTKDDFRSMIEKAHELDMLVILDWVANHSSWDNVWIDEHPDWYTQDSAGNIVAPVEDWSDVADLNYNNQEMRNEMVNSMKFWIENFDIDGFRCDVAMMVPTDFWDSARVELDKVKPVFMLSEAEEPDLMETAFDLNYTWDFLHLTEDIAKGNKRAVDLIDYFLNDPAKFPVDKAIRMNFTSNHDENSWNGSVYERYPNCYKTFAALTFVVPGMPLIYSGQEACLDKKLAFFTKDTIDWNDCDMTLFYKQLSDLKINNSALWNGIFGSNLEFVSTENNEQILTFFRQNHDNKILCLFNLADSPTDVKYTEITAEGTYTDYFTGETVEINLNDTYHLKPWEFRILIF
ncbi:MAG: alpha-glucosidase C-terminal domain-containing protein [Bacteroidales bacterium]|nr:alpha-glucosidase C-terminal domain-containing protein [Bacteroidales bacterium]